VNELALRADTDSWADMLPAVGDLAGKISTTNFVPKGLRGKPAEIAACILTGREVGIGPMESLSKIHVIDGRPAMSSELMRSLVMRDGHEITYAVLTEDKVTAKGRRAGSQEWTEVTWTMKDAQRIGVAGRDTWKKYPRQMLAARATSELCRLLFPDALGGISYTPEELDEDQGEQPRTAVRRSKGRTSEVAQDIPEPELDPQEPPQAVLDGASGADEAAVTVEATAEPEIADAEIVDDAPVMVTAVMDGNAITGPQTKMMGAAMRTLGMDRDQALDFCREHTGRDIQSRNDLTKNEATAIIEALHALRDLTGASDA
jgi:hypothetical protein